MKNRFDGLLSFKEATDMWGLSESTLRKKEVLRHVASYLNVCSE